MLFERSVTMWTLMALSNCTICTRVVRQQKLAHFEATILCYWILAESFLLYIQAKTQQFQEDFRIKLPVFEESVVTKCRPNSLGQPIQWTAGQILDALKYKYNIKVITYSFIFDMMLILSNNKYCSSCSRKCDQLVQQPHVFRRCICHYFAFPSWWITNRDILYKMCS